MLDIRCSATLDEPSREQGRCQLLMGHEGGHAVMFGCHGHLEVRSWKGTCVEAAVDHIAAAEMRPWARGFPRPAWFETAVAKPRSAARPAGEPAGAVPVFAARSARTPRRDVRRSATA